jgi:hypothetical protein
MKSSGAAWSAPVSQSTVGAGIEISTQPRWSTDSDGRLALHQELLKPDRHQSALEDEERSRESAVSIRYRSGDRAGPSVATASGRRLRWQAPLAVALSGQVARCREAGSPSLRRHAAVTPRCRPCAKQKIRRPVTGQLRGNRAHRGRLLCVLSRPRADESFRNEGRVRWRLRLRVVCHASERQPRRRRRSLSSSRRLAADARNQRQAGVRHLGPGDYGSRRAWRTCAFCESARQHVGAGWTLAARAIAQQQSSDPPRRDDCYAAEAVISRGRTRRLLPDKLSHEPEAGEAPALGSLGSHGAAAGGGTAHAVVARSDWDTPGCPLEKDAIVEAAASSASPRKRLVAK